MKILVARRKTMHVFHASGACFALNLQDPESDLPDFREVSSLRMPTGGEVGFDLRASFQPLPQVSRPALRNS